MDLNLEDGHVPQNPNRFYVPLYRQRELNDLRNLMSSVLTVGELQAVSPKLAACLQQSELRARLDVTERVVMSAFVERFERLNRKYKPLLDQLHDFNVQFYTPSMMNMDNLMDECSESESFHSTSSESRDSTTMYCSTCSSTTMTNSQSD
ncbi:hypothetical protein M3Y96_00289500 [Aphelenchoides besseyi]|nr:hypothetical protein M3Y96_00289500 [Aphelenchoides besseyi]